MRKGSRERIEKERKERDKREMRRRRGGGPKRINETVSHGQVPQGSHKYIS